MMTEAMIEATIEESTCFGKDSEKDSFKFFRGRLTLYSSRDQTTVNERAGSLTRLDHLDHRGVLPPIRGLFVAEQTNTSYGVPIFEKKVLRRNR